MVEIKANPKELQAFLKSLKKEKKPEGGPRGSRSCGDCTFYNSKGYCGLYNVECVNSPSRPHWRKKEENA